MKKTWGKWGEREGRVEEEEVPLLWADVKPEYSTLHYITLHIQHTPRVSLPRILVRVEKISRGMVRMLDECACVGGGKAGSIDRCW